MKLFHSGGGNVATPRDDLEIFGHNKSCEVGGFEKEEAEEFERVVEDEIGFFEEDLHAIDKVRLLAVPEFWIFLRIGFDVFGVVVFLFDIFPN